MSGGGRQQRKIQLRDAFVPGRVGMRIHAEIEPESPGLSKGDRPVGGGKIGVYVHDGLAVGLRQPG